MCHSTSQNTSQPLQPKQPSRSNRSQKQQKQSQKQVHFISENTDPVDTVDTKFNSVVVGSKNNSTPFTEAYAVIKMEPYVGQTKNLCGKVDSGAQGNILPLRTYKQIFPDSLATDGHPTRSQPSGDGLTMYDGSSIKHYGTITMPCRYKDSNWSDATFYITETPGPIIFGIPTGIVLNLLQMNCNVNVSSQQAQKISSTSHLQSMYPGCFEGLGICRHMQTSPKEDQPIIHASRHAPVQLRDRSI